MRIMICSLTYPLRNGVTVSIDTAVDGLREKGHEACIIAPDYGRKHREEHSPVPSSSFVFGITHSILGKEERVFGIGAKGEIKRIAEEFCPDIYFLHTVTWIPNYFESHMMKSERPKVLFYHTMVEEYGRIYAGSIGAFVMRKRSRDLCNGVDAVMVPGERMKRKLLEYGVSTPVHVVPTGIEMPEKLFTKEEVRKKFSLPKEKKILLYLGRVSKEKNVEALLHALKELKKQRDDVLLLFVGPGGIEETKESARDMELENDIFFTGSLSAEEARKVFGGCDLFLFPSHTETQGLVVGEAMLAKLPVVIVPSPAQEEFYPSDKVFLAKESKDIPQKIMEALNDEEGMKRRAREGKIYARERFSKERMMEKQIDILKNVLYHKEGGMERG